MKNIMILMNFIFSVFLFSQNVKLYEYRTGLFSKNGNELILAINHPIGNSEINEGYVFSIENKGKQKYLNIVGAIITNMKKTLIDVSKVPGGFESWSINLFKREGTTESIGLEFQYWGEKGKRTTDPINILWNRQKNEFVISNIDPSQY